MYREEEGKKMELEETIVSSNIRNNIMFYFISL